MEIKSEKAKIGWHDIFSANKVFAPVLKAISRYSFCSLSLEHSHAPILLTLGTSCYKDSTSRLSVHSTLHSPPPLRSLAPLKNGERIWSTHATRESLSLAEELLQQTHTNNPLALHCENPCSNFDLHRRSRETHLNVVVFLCFQAERQVVTFSIIYGEQLVPKSYLFVSFF